MRRLGAVLIVLGAVGVAGALLSFARLGVRELGFAIFAGVTSPRGALLGGLALLAAGAVLRRRAPGPPGR